MKKIYLFLFAAFSYSLNAQLTQANHAPANGDLFDTYQCDSVAPGAAGANMVWNFSTISTHSSVIQNYTAQTVPVGTYQGTMAVAASINNITYYNSTANGLYFYGGNLPIPGYAASVNYTMAPAIYAAYPMSLNTTSTAITGGSINVTSPASASGAFNGTSTTLADGTGTIMLPGSVTYTNVLRVVNTQTLTFTIIIPCTVITQNYEYYTPTLKNPVFSISTLTFTPSFGTPTTNTITTINKAVFAPTVTTTGLNQHSESLVLNVYPNPSATFINFTSENQSMATLKVYDITGKFIDTQIFHDGKIKLDVAGYTKGIYFYTVFDASDAKLKAGKFTVVQQ